MKNGRKKALPRERKPLIRELVFAALTYLACTVDLDVKSLESLKFNIAKSFGTFSPERLLLLPGLVLIYLAIGKRCFRTRGLQKAPFFTALLFSFFMLFGRAFENWNAFGWLFSVGNGQIIKSAVFFCGYAILFYYLLCFVYDLLTRANARPGAAAAPRTYPKAIGWYIRALQARPFLTVFLTLLIVSVPNMIMSYPARLMGDSPAQIIQAYPELKDAGLSYFTPENLLKEGVYINQHHPAAHTLLIHACLVLGEAVTGTINNGLFLYAVLQALVMITSYAYACSAMVRKTGLPAAGILLTVLYAVIHPMIINYTFLVTKDSIYAALVLVCLVNLFLLLSGETGRRRVILTTLSMIGIVLCRNEGRYILYLFLVLAVLLNRQARLRFAAMLLVVAVFSAGVFHLLYPALGFTPGSRREMLSVPFQQTARYVRDHDEEVTEEEWQAINKVLKYKSLADLYAPAGAADYVKNTFREEATGEDLKNYFRVWAQMLLKHPVTYIQATMNNYYEVFYPGKARLHLYSAEVTGDFMEIINESLEPIGKSFSRPDSLEWMRGRYIFESGLIPFVPVFDVLTTPAVSAWIVIILLGWAISRKNRKAACLALLPLIILLFNLLGPCNGSYGRYLFPLVFALPMILWMTARTGGSADHPEKRG